VKKEGVLRKDKRTRFIFAKTFDMHDFWIGDWIMIISSGKKGKFEGEINGMAKIKSNKKIILAPFNDILILDDGEFPTTIKTTTYKSKLKPKSENLIPFNNILDLHIEKLAPELSNKLPEHIISYQVRKAKEFIMKAIEKRQLQIVLIHGKGSGVLKAEIENLLQDFNEVYFMKSINDGGAIEVMLNYGLA